MRALSPLAHNPTNAHAVYSNFSMKVLSSLHAQSEHQNKKIVQRDRVASLISGTDPEHISPRYLYLLSSLVRLFYEGFPLTPAHISVLEKTNRYSAQTRSAQRRARQSSFEATQIFTSRFSASKFRPSNYNYAKRSSCPLSKQASHI